MMYELTDGDRLLRLAEVNLSGSSVISAVENRNDSQRKVQVRRLRVRPIGGRGKFQEMKLPKMVLGGFFNLSLWAKNAGHLSTAAVNFTSALLLAELINLSLDFFRYTKIKMQHICTHFLISFVTYQEPKFQN